MALAPPAPQLPLEQPRDLELTHPDAHLSERRRERLACQSGRAADRCDLAWVLARAQPLYQVARRLPAPGLPRLRQPLRVLHRERVRFVADPGEWPERRQLAEQPVPDA